MILKYFDKDMANWITITLPAGVDNVEVQTDRQNTGEYADNPLPSFNIHIYRDTICVCNGDEYLAGITYSDMNKE